MVVTGKTIGAENTTLFWCAGLRARLSARPSIPGCYSRHAVRIRVLLRGSARPYRAITYRECAGCDPKDGELCLIRLKSGETLMEDRSNSDVQIDCQNWA